MTEINALANDNKLLNAALGFLASGCSIVPTRSDGSKAPLGNWKKWQSERPDSKQVAEWFSDPKVQGFGVVTGAISGNLEMLEMEGRAVNAGMLEEVKEIAIASGLGAIWDVLVNGYVEMTPSGGIHFLYRIADEPVPPSTKLAQQPGENGGVEVLAETRGEAAYCIVAPSFGSTHPSGKPWELINGSPALLPMLSMEERDAIHACFIALDKLPTVEIVREAAQPRNEDGSKSPGTDFNERTTWDELLIPRGWRKIRTNNEGVTTWGRPGKNFGVSATTGKTAQDNLWVFTTSTEFQAGQPYSKFAALTLWDFGGDYSACAKELVKRGYGPIKVVPDLPKLGAKNSLPSFQERQEKQNQHIKIGDGFEENTNEQKESFDEEDASVEITSWLPKPLNFDNTDEEPKPEFLPREDGEFLFYRGKVNGLVGESESGKSWLAQFAVQQALAVGQRVIYLDFEDTARGILSRLKALGATREQIDNFLYAQPDERLDKDASVALYGSLVSFKPDLIILDGVNAAMSLLGLDINSNNDATQFSQSVLRPLKSQGACVITIDHVPKSKDNRGNYAIGAQAKRADIDGCAISVAVVAPFGRGQNGELKMTVIKDRPGHVRAIALGAKAVGIAHLRSGGEDKVRIIIEGLREKNGGFRPTHLMEKVSKLLEGATTPITKSAVMKGIEGKADSIQIACQVLIDDGYVSVSNGARNSLLLTSIKPYREVNDPSSNEYKWKEVFTVDDEEGENGF